MINKTVESGRSRVGQCGRPPSKTSPRHLGLHPQSGIRFSSSTSYTLTAPLGNRKNHHKKLDERFSCFAKQKKKVSVKTETFSSFLLHVPSQRRRLIFPPYFFFFSRRVVYICRHSSMNNYRKSLVPVSRETRAFSVLPKASRSSHSQRGAELRFRTLVRYRSVA